MVNILHFKQLLVTAALLFVSASSFAYDFEVDGIYYNVVSLSDLTCEVTTCDIVQYKYTGNIVIPKTVTYKNKTLSIISIGKYAFSNCKRLTSIYIPEGVTSIGNFAFIGCNNLKSINIPDGVVSIGNHAFYECSCLNSVNIGKGITSIEDNTFWGCLSLTSINIPEGVTSIGNGAFSLCKSLTSIEIPYTVTSIGNGAFSSCPGLTSIIVGSNYSIQQLCKTTIENITLSENYTDNYITSISDYSGLKKLTIKTTKGLTWNSEEPVTKTQYINLEVIVPTYMLIYYQAADKWKDFWNLNGGAENEGSGISDITIDNVATPAVIYDLNGRKLSEPKHGLNIINGKKVVVK